MQSTGGGAKKREKRRYTEERPYKREIPCRWWGRGLVLQRVYVCTWVRVRVRFPRCRLVARHENKPLLIKINFPDRKRRVGVESTVPESPPSPPPHTHLLVNRSVSDCALRSFSPLYARVTAPFVLCIMLCGCDVYRHAVGGEGVASECPVVFPFRSFRVLFPPPAFFCRG